MKNAVLDASVLLACYLPSGRKTESLRLIQDFAERRLDLLSPDLMLYEFINSVYVAHMRLKIIGRHDADEMIASFINLRLHLIDVSAIIHDIFRVCGSADISGYDASYIALANHLDIDFITIDRKLYNKTKKLFNCVKLL